MKTTEKNDIQMVKKKSKTLKAFLCKFRRARFTDVVLFFLISENVRVLSLFKPCFTIVTTLFIC